MQLKDPPFDYRDELGDDNAIACCLDYARDRKAWHEMPYWIEILIQRERRAKGLQPTK